MRHHQADSVWGGHPMGCPPY